MLFNLIQQEGIPVISPSVDELGKTAIDLAEATYNYGALKVIFGIFMVTVILLLLLFVYQTISNQRDFRSVVGTLKKIGEHFDSLDDRSLGKEEGKLIIRSTINYLGVMIKYQILRIRLENHIDDKEAIVDKVTKSCNNIYNDMQNYLSRFLINDSALSTAINYTEDNKLVQEMILNHVYTPSDRFTVSLMDENVSILIEGFKNDASRVVDKF